MKFHKEIKYIVGIDEAGRGPLAGPVAVGACLVPISFTRKHFKGIKDSKKLTEKLREEWFSKLQKEFTEKNITYSVTLVSNTIIDTKGLSFAISFALKTCLKRLQAKPEECLILLDGGLKAPYEFKYQKTIIKGDEKEFAISLASIAAKVTRDRLMVKLSKKYPLYGFEIHKGYGTKVHRENIKKHGISPFHRRTFLKRFNTKFS